MYLRRVRDSDEDITYSWVNDFEIRKYSLNKDWVSPEEHRRWFLIKLTDPNTYYYILEDEGEFPLGSIRFDFTGDEFKVNYLISPQFHGQGLGRDILLMGLQILQKESEGMINVVGWVFKQNIASMRIFQSLDFNVLEENHELVKFGKIF